jgi:acyl-CoA thioester hydrolase
MALLLPLVPEHARSTTELRVRFCDTDLMGVVHHANTFAYFEMGRVEWLRRRGLSYREWSDRGLHFAVVEANAKYRSPARFDDLLTVEVTLTELRPASLRLEYRIFRSDVLIAEGGTRHACVDNAGHLQRLSKELIAVLQRPELEPKPVELVPRP